MGKARSEGIIGDNRAPGFTLQLSVENRMDSFRLATIK